MKNIQVRQPQARRRQIGQGGALAALRHHNFRLYFAAQIVSSLGSWVQITVENWLVLTLTYSGLALGVTNALQFGPSVVFGMYGGVIADRCDRRRVLLVTQTCMGVLALAVGLAVGMGVVHVWMIWLAAAGLGLIKCFDLPALQSFVKDLVGTADLPNAVGLSNVISATGRMTGPMLGALVLARFGIATGFAINAATFAVVVLMLMALDRADLVSRSPVPREPGQIRQGLIYVFSDPVLAVVSIIMIVVFASAYNFQISLALIASDTLAGSGETYGALMSVLGLGALTGSLILARRGRTGVPVIIVWTAALAVAQAAVAAVNGIGLLLAAVFAYGVSAGLFSVTVISTLQLRSAEDVRGRVMAVYSVAFLGSSLAGAPAFGGLAEWVGVPAAMRATACICAVVALAALAVQRGMRRSGRAA